LNNSLHTCDIILKPIDNRRLASLCGRFDEHLRQIEKSLGVEITNRGNIFQVGSTSLEAVETAKRVITTLYKETNKDVELTPSQVHLSLRQQGAGSKMKEDKIKESELSLHTRAGEVKPRSLNQTKYVHNLLTHDVNFGIGPAGTGKTFLAVACAVAALEQEKIRRILLVRPAVEAGERLGFLPGDLSQKIDPYLRPLYDALYEMLGYERVSKLLEKQVIEIASLAYMRGRTLNDAFIILDEGQNATTEQMKMFLTRLGFSSTAVITGDITQIDLPKGRQSGLKQVMGLLQEVPGVSFTFFQSVDVVRHPVVQRIIEAYEQFEDKQNNNGASSDH
jgi:phosphate starvation-inducible PhoH-like protein